MTVLVSLGVVLLVFLGLFFGLAEFVHRFSEEDRRTLYQGAVSSLFENFFVFGIFTLLLFVAFAVSLSLDGLGEQITGIKAACTAAAGGQP